MYGIGRPFQLLGRSFFCLFLFHFSIRYDIIESNRVKVLEIGNPIRKEMMAANEEEQTYCTESGGNKKEKNTANETFYIVLCCFSVICIGNIEFSFSI